MLMYIAIKCSNAVYYYKVLYYYIYLYSNVLLYNGIYHCILLYDTILIYIDIQYYITIYSYEILCYSILHSIVYGRVESREPYSHSHVSAVYKRQI